MNEELRAAAKRLRAFVNAWVDEYGEQGFLPRLGTVPALAVADLKAILGDWEGEPGWAVVSEDETDKDGFEYYNVHGTFVWKEDAVALVEKLGPGHYLAWWDENGSRGSWRK